MRLRYLFGPVERFYADDNLAKARQDGQCLAFAPSGADLVIRHDDRWEDVRARLPAGWSPDVIVLMLAYTSIPAGLWEAPIPLIGLALDWHLLWHRYRFALPRCDMVVTDAWGVERFGRAGLAAVPGNLFGCAPAFLEPAPARARDIDILYVGSLHPAEQRARLPWLRRLATDYGENRNVVIRCGLARDAYRQLLQRTRIVFNHSVRRECNLRVFEAAASGALLFQEAENAEVADYFTDGESCVLYTQATLDPLLRFYLENEPARSRLAAAAASRVQAFGFAELWDRVVQQIAQRLPDLRRAARDRHAAGKSAALDRTGRVWEALCCHTGTDRQHDAEGALVGELTRSSSADADELLAFVAARQAQRHRNFDRECCSHAVELLQKAVARAPDRILLRLNLAEALWRAGVERDAADACRHALARLEASSTLDDADLNAPHFPPAFDTFRVEWERAAWANAGCPAAEGRSKRRLLEWRLRSMLAALTGDLAQYGRAAELRGDLWTSQAALGRALLRADRAHAAVPHLRRAAELNPFDPELAEDVQVALRSSGDAAGADQFAAECGLLRRAFPAERGPEIRFAREVTR